MLGHKRFLPVLIEIAVFTFYLLPALVFAADAQTGAEPPPLPLWAQSVNTFIKGFAGRIWDLAVVLTSVGVASMALIETTKNLFPSIHRRFHRRRIIFYLTQVFRRKESMTFQERVRESAFYQRSMRFFPWVYREKEEETFRDAWHEMISLAAAGNERALFNLPAEQIMGQIGAAARVALDFPDKYPALCSTLAGHAKAEDLKLVMETIGAERKQPEHVDARNRVFSLVQRKLDATLISVKEDWTWWNRFAAVTSSIILILSALWVSGNLRSDRSLGFYLVAAVLGGFVAPVAKDLVASLERFRKK